MSQWGMWALRNMYIYNGDLITMVTNSQQNWQQKITSIVIVCENMHRSVKY